VDGLSVRFHAQRKFFPNRWSFAGWHFPQQKTKKTQNTWASVLEMSHLRVKLICWTTAWRNIDVPSSHPRREAIETTFHGAAAAGFQSVNGSR
jgi:hypothetical protein